MKTALSVIALTVTLGLTSVIPADAQRAYEPLAKETYRLRREKFRDAMDGGIAIIVAARKDQDFIYEFFVDHSDLHDFIYLTGLEGVDTWETALVLAPDAEAYKEILYTSQDPDEIREKTGIEHVYPYELLMEHLSDALTDYSLLRTHQRGSKALATDLSRSLGEDKNVYFNYQRFLNLSETPPKRLEIANRLRYFSPEVTMKDASDILNRLRMIHDDEEIALLRRASEITVKAFMESAKAVHPGMTTQQIAAIVDFTFEYEHAAPSFRTNVSITGPDAPSTGQGREWPLGSRPRLGPWPVKDGQMINYDIGAEYAHYTADFGRSIPVSGRYTPEQRRIAEAVTRVQKQVIAAVKPGGTFTESQALKDRLMAAAGLGDATGSYGISHFVGMEIHDVGFYDIPWEPGMCFVIEWNVTQDSFSMRFEDVILVTEDGHEWLTESSPMEPDEIEALMAQPGIWEQRR
ncbi:MAG TPA: Xaa-Pro peptidase family protein [Longimicrobiales bacterium]|nr:Xaa-Pro peptidase family protein [Longimicrobiales bacterium]